MKMMRQLLRAPDFGDIWSQLFCLASAYRCAKKKVSDFYHNGSKCALYCAHEPVSSSSQKAKFFCFSFYYYTAGAKMYCKDVKVLIYVSLCMYVCLCYSMGKQGFVALNLSKLEDMQTRLRRNLEAIGMLNQQVRAHTHTHTHTPGPGSPFTRQIQTHTHTLAHLLLSSHRRGSFHASNFKRTRALTHTHTHTQAHTDIHFPFLR